MTSCIKYAYIPIYATIIYIYACSKAGLGNTSVQFQTYESYLFEKTEVIDFPHICLFSNEFYTILNNRLLHLVIFVKPVTLGLET